jgi:hypothetical protein
MGNPRSAATYETLQILLQNYWFVIPLRSGFRLILFLGVDPEFFTMLPNQYSVPAPTISGDPDVPIEPGHLQSEEDFKTTDAALKTEEPELGNKTEAASSTSTAVEVTPQPPNPPLEPTL